jgi:hypothetical protein
MRGRTHVRQVPQCVSFHFWRGIDPIGSQARGPQSFARPTVLEKLKLTDDPI